MYIYSNKTFNLTYMKVFVASYLFRGCVRATACVWRSEMTCWNDLALLCFLGIIP